MAATFDDLDELLSQSIELGVGKVNPASQPQAQDFLTADLFSNMTDDEVLTHFMPIRGIDYDANYFRDDPLSVKKEKDDQDAVIYMADEFLPYRMIPQINPVYQLNAELFKSVVPIKRARESIKHKTDSSNASLIENDVNNQEKQTVMNHIPLNNPEKQSAMNKNPEDSNAASVQNARPVVSSKEKKAPTEEMSELSSADEKVTSNKKNEPRQIIKRKPRTYKYNPKPLQQKVNRAFVPDDLKDVEYWERRKRNNEAAKKSRKERREKELEIIQHYEEMRREIQSIKNENIRLKARNALLEKQIKELRGKK